MPQANPADLFLTIISSRIVHAFGPILKSAASGLRFLDGALFIYPHDDGALCIATDGYAIMMMLDREAKIDEPRSFHLPDALIDACAPPAPLVAHYPGWQEDRAMPEWMQPARVLLWRHGASVLPAMPHPADVDDAEDTHSLCSARATDKARRMLGRDYWHGRPPLDPRLALASPVNAEYRADLDPARVAMFVPAMDIFDPPTVTWTPGGPGGAVVFLMEGVPDFIGLLMPWKVPNRLGWPAFASELAASLREAPAEDRRTEVAEGRP